MRTLPAGVETDFHPPVEKLAYQVKSAGEADLPEVWSEPLEVVVSVLETAATFTEVNANLPDVELFGHSR